MRFAGVMPCVRKPGAHQPGGRRIAAICRVVHHLVDWLRMPLPSSRRAPIAPVEFDFG